MHYLGFSGKRKMQNLKPMPKIRA
ncbi:hypothetical protein CNECB9_1260006 [Cupriavidus necator]|uniref:Uncharacterized protein n=1 Tax=Cupriavidus necator TaxID=106590 RepID=A0A1K0I8Q9_CUPNE|nr:hypothetical protein CNECB9_1260006 [Cupriavidus necator]